MITGFNTDVDCGGVVYHVQTEDKGIGNPIVETLVYTGGQIVCARKTPYADRVEAGEHDEAAILELMEGQHRELIDQIRDGTLTKEDLEPFGWNIVSDRSFEEVVRTFLETELPLEALKVALVEPEQLRPGAKATLRLAVTEETSERPVVGASVVVELVGQAGEQTELFSASTDRRGEIAAPCELPEQPEVGASVVFRAEASGVSAELRCSLKRRRSQPSAQRP